MTDVVTQDELDALAAMRNVDFKQRLLVLRMPPQDIDSWWFYRDTPGGAETLCRIFRREQ